MTSSALESLQPAPGHVVMMCGIAGAGKTRIAKALETKGFVRLSIDEYIWQHFGQFGFDYPEEKYAELQAAAELANLATLDRLLEQRAACVIDYSFWRRSDRLRYRQRIANAGGHTTLLYLPADAPLLRSRLQARNKSRNANAAFALSDEELGRYIAGFEAPRDEADVLVIPQNV